MIDAGWETWGFRITVIAGLLGLFWSARKIIKAIQDAAVNEAAFKTKVREHLEEAEALIPEHRAHSIQIATSLLEVRAQGERLDRFIKTQDDANADFRSSIKWLMRNARNGVSRGRSST